MSQGPESAPEPEDDIDRVVEGRRQRAQAKKALMIGVPLVLVVMGIGAYGMFGRFSGNDGKSQVRTGEAPDVSQAPGAAKLPPEVAKQLKDTNDIELKRARDTGATFVPPVNMQDSKPLPAASAADLPKPDALSERGSTGAPPAGGDPFARTSFQVGGGTTGARQEDQAYNDAVRDTMKRVADRNASNRGGLVSFMPDKEGMSRATAASYTGGASGVAGASGSGAYIIPSQRGGSADAGSAGGGVHDALSDAVVAGGADSPRGSLGGTGAAGRRDDDTSTSRSADNADGALVAGPHQAYAMSRNAADTDAPSDVMADVLSGPFNGALIKGAFKVGGGDNMTLNFSRMWFNNHWYTINAIAIDTEQLSAAIPAEVDNRYFQRIIIPSAVGFVQKLASSFAQPNTTTVVTTGSTVVASPSRTVKEDVAAGLAGGADTAASTINADAAATKARHWLPALQPMTLWFIEPVRE